MDLVKHNQKAQALKKENRIFFDKLKRLTYKNLDTYFQEVHEDVFGKTDCLSCANCCKTTSPIFYNRDIERLAKHFKIKPGDFIERYLKIDEDKDYVLFCKKNKNWLDDFCLFWAIRNHFIKERKKIECHSHATSRTESIPQLLGRGGEGGLNSLQATDLRMCAR